MKKRRVILFCAAAILLAGGWSWRYVSLNEYYNALSQETREVFALGDVVPFGEDYMTKGVSADGYSLRADRFEIVDYADYAAGLGVEQEDGAPEKLALVYITLFNEDNDGGGIALTAFQLHGMDNYVGLSWDMLTAANPELGDNYGIALSPGTEYELVIPFELDSALFGADTWRHLEDYTFYFQITAYPTEKDIRVQ